MKRLTKSVSASALALAAIAGLAHAGNVPMLLAHQGRLFDADGYPSSGSIGVTYSLYTSATGGTPVWSERETTPVNDGFFSSVLGDGTTFTSDLFAGQQLYLGITINNEELVPRTQMVSVPYALLANDVVGDIHPRSITIGDKEVVDENGAWVGDRAGLTGPQGPAGATGPRGVDGAAGAQGPTGDVGPAGPAGVDGAAGPMGPIGVPGAIGPMGAPGLACWDADQSGACDLLTEDRDTSGTCDVADCVGPAGAVGPQGPAGADGPIGPAGADGATGPQGPAGADGAIGPQGPAGADGATGPQGPAGATGPAGADGAIGPQGLAGADGAMGPQGPAGADGAIGPQGPAGADGAAGATGAAGADGATGPMGPQGPAGNDGLDGATGPMGPQGPMGLMGPLGPTGPQGPAGNDGLDGATGPMGPQGPQGPAGNDGLDGATGPMGPQGPQGPAGNDGLDGATGPMGPQGPQGATGPSGGDVAVGLSHMVSGHYAPGSAVSYYSPSAYAYGEGSPTAANSLYVPSTCDATLFVKSTMNMPVEYRLRAVEPVSPTVSDLGTVLANCSVGVFGGECTMNATIPAGMFFTIEVVQMFAGDGSFYTSMTCN